MGIFPSAIAVIGVDNFILYHCQNDVGIIYYILFTTPQSRRVLVLSMWIRFETGH